MSASAQVSRGGLLCTAIEKFDAQFAANFALCLAVLALALAGIEWFVRAHVLTHGVGYIEVRANEKPFFRLVRQNR